MKENLSDVLKAESSKCFDGYGIFPIYHSDCLEYQNEFHCHFFKSNSAVILIKYLFTKVVKAFSLEIKIFSSLTISLPELRPFLLKNRLICFPEFFVFSDLSYSIYESNPF